MTAFVRVALAMGLFTVSAALYGCGGGGGGTPPVNMNGTGNTGNMNGTGNTGTMADFGQWEIVTNAAGDRAGFEHTAHGLKVYYEPNLSPVITDSSPAHQPTVSGTWEGRWAGFHGLETEDGGRAEINVVINENNVEATLTYFDVMVAGDVTAEPATVVDGRFSPVATVPVGSGSLTFSGGGQFGGTDQNGVVGYIDGRGWSFVSVFYGDRK